MMGIHPLPRLKNYWAQDDRLNVPGVSKLLKKTRRADRLKAGEVKLTQSGPMVATAWQDERIVTILSTNVQPEMASALRQTGRGPRAEKPIPQAVPTYNGSMGCVELFDQHRAYYQVGRPSKKWWRYLLWFLVEAAMINAFIIFKKTTTPSKKPRQLHDPLKFRLDVYDGLIKKGIGTRRQLQNRGTLVGRASSDPTQHTQDKLPGREANCVLCQKRGVRTESGRGVQTVFGCLLCKVHLCKGECFAKFHAELLQ